MRTKPKMLSVILAVATALVSPLVIASSSEASHRSPTAQHSAIIKCHGHRATIVRGARSNTIIGTQHRDIIWAGAGHDRVLGRGGNDLICGGAGRDMLDGNIGGDTDYGGPGKDWCVAWHPREHRLHHACEIHVGLAGHRHPHKARGPVQVASLVRAGVALPQLSMRRAPTTFSTCEGGSVNCTAGAPICQPGNFDYTNQPQPEATFANPGLVAIYAAFQAPDANGAWQEIFHQAVWSIYDIPNPGRWSMAVNPASNNLGVYGNPNSGLVNIWFSYSGDGGATWSPQQWAQGHSYFFAAGAGVSSGLPTAECDF